jgi:hypothetical protein
MITHAHFTPDAPTKLESVGPKDSRSIDAQHVGFWLCCAYILTQIYMVPVWLVGPSWSVWPSLTDLVVPAMLICLPFVCRSQRDANKEVRAIQRYLLFLAGGSAVSYVALTLDILPLKTMDVLNEKGPSVGLYQLYRLSQFLIVFWLASRIDLTPSRKRWLRGVIAATFWISCALLLANYFDLIDTPTLGSHIPRDLSTAGPWSFYARGVVGSPVGGISFHRAYPAVQLLLLAAIYLYLLPESRVWLPSLILSCLWVCGLVSGSRAGFVAVCIFVAAAGLPRLRRLFAIAVFIVASALAWVCFSGDLAEAFSTAVARQQSIATSYEEDGLAGRVGIWNDRLELLNQNPLFWLGGTGFGSAVESGSNGHMLFLQTTLECGLIGTAAFLYVIGKISMLMWRLGSRGRILFFATVALLVSSLTQETFYPVPALGHFCGMYLFCVGIAFFRPTPPRRSLRE